ncbi:serine/threonine protein kinase [Paenibacillus pinistramenti]|uniref:serine/threonine protein kinase n=1 Tax=Paenibacillus pinistramenti TaxID=1768003 RepID=UPI00110831C1|nr:serine/threonine-protein kinase [Paenibacillus pinistramenti]
MAQMPDLLEPGALLGDRYTIARHTGSGGSSHVYVANDLKLPGKVWAVKQTLTAAEGISRMEEEAGMLIALDHPRLPRIVDFFIQDEAAFLVMDYVEGVTLEDYLQKSRAVSEAQLLRIADQVCEGLHYLHTREPPIIYRDLKPSNLMVEQSGEIRFVDFGTARAYKPQLSEDTIQLGTVGFAAPEQYLGLQSDPRTDMYALGAIMLYLASNGKYTQWPKEGGLPGSREISPELTRIIRKLLSYEPGDRFQSAREVQEELHRLSSFPAGFVRVNEVSKRPVVVAVTGAVPGVGVTHFSLMLAHALAGLFPKITYVDWNARSSAFAGLLALSSYSGSLADSFEMRSVTYHKKPSRAEWLQILGSGSRMIIMDLGVDMDKDGLEEFARSDLQLVVLPASVWRRKEIEQCSSRLAAYPGRHRKYIVPLADQYGVQQIGRLLKGSKVYGLPAEPDPFNPGEGTVELARRICEGVLPNKQRSGRWMPGWLKIR